MEYEKGKTVAEAALAAARLRLRPILMTSFAFILGVVPLVLSSGSGAHGRILLGIAVLGGMLAASLLAIFLIPVAFAVVQTLAHRRGGPIQPTPDTPMIPVLQGDGDRQSAPVAVPAHYVPEGER